MGQILSYIWGCIRPNNIGDRHAKTTLDNYNHHFNHFKQQHANTNLHNEKQFNPLEQQNPYVTITIPDNNNVELKSGSEEVAIQVENKEVTNKTLARPSKVNKRVLGPYNSMQKILLVGEGDFSFSTSLALASGSASNIIATSLNSQDFLRRNYSKFLANKMELEIRGCMVIHGVDATNMVEHYVLGSLRFDCIIFNFPHTGNFGGSDSDMSKNRNLVRGFLRSAKKMIAENGEIHITHKSSGFFRKWDIPRIGLDQGLHLFQEIDFSRSMYSGYHTKYGFGGNKDFNCHPSKTYKFRRHPN